MGRVTDGFARGVGWPGNIVNLNRCSNMAVVTIDSRVANLPGRGIFFSLASDPIKKE